MQLLRNNTEKSYIHIPIADFISMVTSWKTSKYCSQDTDIGAVQLQDSLSTTRAPPVALLEPHPCSPTPTPLGPGLFSISVILPFQERYINGVIQHLTFWELALFTQDNFLEIRPGCMQCLFLFAAECCPWCGCTTATVTVHALKDFWAVSSVGQLQIKLLWMFMCRFLCGCKFSFLWDEGPGGQQLVASLVLQETANLFSRAVAAFCISLSSARVIPFFTESSQHGGVSLFSLLAIMIDGRWYLTVV